MKHALVVALFFVAIITSFLPLVNIDYTHIPLSVWLLLWMISREPIEKGSN